MLTAHQAIKVMRVLVADPCDESLASITSKLKTERFEKVFTVRSGEEALRMLSVGLASREPIDLLLLSLDLPDRPGLETFEEVHNVFDVGLVLLSNREDRHLVLEGMGRGADDYVLRPVNADMFLLKAEKLLTQRFLKKEIRRSTARNETLFLNVLAVMAKVLEAKDPYTRFHSHKVSELSSQVAREMGFQDDEVRRIGVAGILHDIGKMGIREAILKKPGPLDKAEREIVQRHSIIASTILEPIEQLQSAVGYIKHHHEHFDGSGYPDKLSGEQIPLGARIIHAAEAFDAMVATRSYNVPKTPEEALAELRRCSGTQFDPQVVEATAAVLRRTGQLTARVELPPKSLPELLEDLTGQVSL
ncbi:MAG TPA: HD domain-containing phosphohydrolase [Planctomycetota bacterium]|nr:HD domain-containing phosphohydrolase [Planctomycetota bacterium]